MGWTMDRDFTRAVFWRSLLVGAFGWGCAPAELDCVPLVNGVWRIEPGECTGDGGTFLLIADGCDYSTSGWPYLSAPLPTGFSIGADVYFEGSSWECLGTTEDGTRVDASCHGPCRFTWILQEPLEEPGV